MVANLKMRYKEESGEWLLLNKAALLDPRFSRLVHLSPAQKHLVTESLSHELTETETDTDRTRQGEKSAAAMGSLFGDLFGAAAAPRPWYGASCSSRVSAPRATRAKAVPLTFCLCDGFVYRASLRVEDIRLGLPLSSGVFRRASDSSTELVPSEAAPPAGPPARLTAPSGRMSSGRQ
ncbi:unnamed protein product [Boreogadus saida]